jgi:hypothetical protein
MSDKNPAADRHHGGPGSSHQDATEAAAPRGTSPAPGEPTNPRHSQVSGGGGERDRHHSHHPRDKGGQRR